MGAFLDKPITEKETEYGHNNVAWWGACSM